MKNIYFVSQNVYFACAAGEMPNVQKLSLFATQNIDYQKHRRCLWEIYFVDLGQCGKYILFPQNVYFARAAGEMPNVQKLSPFATQNIDYQKQPARVVYGVDPTGGLF